MKIMKLEGTIRNPFYAQMLNAGTTIHIPHFLFHAYVKVYIIWKYVGYYSTISSSLFEDD